MEKMVIKKSYIIVDLIYNNFWEGICYTQNPDRIKHFESPEEALKELEEKIIPTFKCIPEIKEIYIKS